MPLRVGEPLAVDCHGSPLTSSHSIQHSDVTDSSSSTVDLRRWLVPLDCAADGELQLAPGYVPAEKLTTLAVEIRNVVTGQCAISVSAPSNTPQQTATTTTAAVGAADSAVSDSMDVDDTENADGTSSSDDTASNDAVNASVRAIHEYLLKVQHSAACEDVFAAVRAEVLSTAATTTAINSSSSRSSSSSTHSSRVWLDTGHGVTDAASAMTTAVAVAASNSNTNSSSSDSTSSSSSKSRRVCGLGADASGLCIAHVLDDDVTVFVDATDADHVMSIKLIRHSDTLSSGSNTVSSTTAAEAVAAAVHSNETGSTVTTTAGDSSMQSLCELALLHLNCLVQDRRRKQLQTEQSHAAAATVKSELAATQMNGSVAAKAPAKSTSSAVPQQQAAVLSATVIVVQHHMFREQVRQCICILLSFLFDCICRMYHV
jgi:hypothetical protein